MKKIFLLLLASILYLSCTKTENTEDITLDLLPVTEVELPSNFYVSDENIITVKFVRPTNCYTFNKFYYQKAASTRTIAVESAVLHYRNGSGCQTLPSNANVATQLFKFNPDKTGEYTLKFWNGKDTNGTDLFLTYTILVE